MRYCDASSIALFLKFALLAGVFGESIGMLGLFCYFCEECLCNFYTDWIEFVNHFF